MSDERPRAGDARGGEMLTRRDLLGVAAAAAAALTLSGPRGAALGAAELDTVGDATVAVPRGRRALMAYGGRMARVGGEVVAAGLRRPH
jgi:hypothetical protein